MSSLAQARLCRHAAVRRFIHTSTRCCTNVSGQTWNWLDAIVRDGDQDASHEFSVAAVPRPKATFVRKSVFDNRSRKRVELVCTRPSFQLSTHPQARHPCVRGLTLDTGNIQPYDEPLVAHRLVQYARTQQLQAAAREALPSLLDTDPTSENVVAEHRHWNVPFKTRLAWFRCQESHPSGKETKLTSRESVKDFETITCVRAMEAPLASCN